MRWRENRTTRRENMYEGLLNTYSGRMFSSAAYYGNERPTKSGILLTTTTNYVALPAILSESGIAELDDQKNFSYNRRVYSEDGAVLTHERFRQRNIAWRGENLILSNYTMFFRFGATGDNVPLFVLVMDRSSPHYEAFLYERKKWGYNSVEAIRLGGEFWFNKNVNRGMRGRAASYLYKIALPLIKEHGIRIVGKSAQEIMTELNPLRMPSFSSISEMKQTRLDIAKAALYES